MSAVLSTSAHQADSGDPRLVSERLSQGDDSIWYAARREPVSYTDDGNKTCFELEEESFWFAHRAACVRATVQRFPPAGAIYDIGGGNGFMTRKLIEAGFDAVLVEPGEEGARNAVQRAIPIVICATLATAQFRESSLPAAAVFDVLEHIDDDASFLRELHRCLPLGGRLYATVPAYSWLWSDDDQVAGHSRRHTLRSMKQRLKAAGFTSLYATYFFSLLPFPLFFSRSLPSLFGRRSFARRSYRQLHRPRLRTLTDRVWAAELRCIERGGVIPMGSSCLLVAEKRTSDD